jgi:hypothetical protein
VSWLYEFDESRYGLQAGVHYDLHDRVQVGVLYVNKGRECCAVHSVEVPITYRHPVGEIVHVLVGVAPGYDDHGDSSEPIEVSALLSLSAEMHGITGLDGCPGRCSIVPCTCSPPDTLRGLGRGYFFRMAQ